MFKFLFLLFITIPILEIYLLISVGQMIGTLNTILVIILTAVVGTALLRQQGLSTLARVQDNMQQGQLPAVELIEGLILLVSGALLLTPGFFTDVIGFLCLIPVTRRAFATRLLSSFIVTKMQSKGRYQQTEVTIEGEYWEEKPEHEQDKLPSQTDQK